MGSYSPPVGYKHTTMNDLHSPKGSWDIAYKAQQAKYNTMLAVSALWCFGSIYLVQSSGKIIWNWGPSMSGPLNVPTDAEIIADLAKMKEEEAAAAAAPADEE